MSEATELEQGSAEWLYARTGHVTASRFVDVLDMRKDGKPGAKRTAYLWEIVIERLTGKPTEHFMSAAMQWGSLQEELSRMAYEAQTGKIVQQVGFVRHPSVPLVGCSPDGLIDDDGLWESKSPYNSANHLTTWLEGMSPNHLPQVQGQLWIMNRSWCIFQSFDPRMPDPLQVYTQQIERDEAYIERLADAISTFQAEADELTSRIRERIK